MTDTVKYEVDDKVEDQLKSLNKGMLAKPQFWLILALKCVDKEILQIARL